jgi:hypothetical protein
LNASIVHRDPLLAGYRACRFYAMRRACLALAELLRATAYDGAQMHELLLVWLKLYDAAIVVAYGHALACCNDPRRAYRVFCERAVQEQLRENVQRMAVDIVGEPRNEPRGSTFEERVLDDIEFAKVRVA